MESFIKNCGYSEEKNLSEDSSSYTLSCTQTLINEEVKDNTLVNNCNLLMESALNKNVYESNIKPENLKYDEQIILNKDFETKTSITDYNLLVDSLNDVQQGDIESEELKSFKESDEQTSLREHFEEKVTTILPIESLNSYEQEDNCVSKNSNSSTKSDEEEDQLATNNCYLPMEPLLNNCLQDHFKSNDCNSPVKFDEPTSLIEHFEDKVTTVDDYVPMESVLNNCVLDENFNLDFNSTTKSNEEISLKEDKVSTNYCYLPNESLNIFVQEKIFKSEDSNSITLSNEGTSLREDKVSTNDCYLPNESLNIFAQEEIFKSEDSNSSTKSNEETSVREDKVSTDYCCLPNESLNICTQEKVFKSEDSNSITKSNEETSLKEDEVSTDDCYLPNESLNICAQEVVFKSEDSNCTTGSDEQTTLSENFEGKVSTGDCYLSNESLNICVKNEIFKTEASHCTTKSDSDNVAIADNYLPIESNSTTSYAYEVSENESEFSLSATQADKDSIWKNDFQDISTPIKRTFLRNDFEDKVTSSNHGLPIQSLYNDYICKNNNLTFDDPFINAHMSYRDEVDELSQKCTSKILAEKERCKVKYRNTCFKVVEERLLNLSLQQSQFESGASGAKVQLSHAYSSNSKDIIKNSKSIIKSFKNDCRLFKNFFPACAFRNKVLSALEDNQVLIISADSYYYFNSVLPIFIKKQYPGVPLVCCQNCEFTRSWLCESLIDFLGDKIVTSLSHKKFIKDQVLCFTEEEMLEVFLKNPCIFQQRMYFVVNIPLVRSVSCDIVLANLLDMLKVNEDSKLILLISHYAEVRDYQKYFSNWMCVSVLKTKCLNLPVDTIWKNKASTPADDYVEEVVRTVLAILVLKEVGDILVFVPQLEDLEHAAEILDRQLVELQHENVEYVLIHENAICDFDMFSFIALTDSRRKIFLATNCGETLFLPSVQHVVDCGIRNVYLYDDVVRTDVSNTVFISRKNADLRKTIAGSQEPGICYRMYNKNNYCEDMQSIDSPEVLMVSPVNAMLKLFQYSTQLRVPYSAASMKLIKGFSENVKLDAVKTLQDCGVIRNRVLTSLGENIAKLPFEVNYSKLILLALEHDLAFEAIVLVAFFTSADNIFLYSNDKNQQRIIDAKKLQLIQNDSDTISYLYIYKMYMDNHLSKEFCDNNFINYEAMDSISSNIKDMCWIVDSNIDVNIQQSFSDQSDSFLCITKLLFECFQKNLCVFTGYIASGYKVLSSSAFASAHSTSLIYQWQILPQFIIYDRVHPTSKDLVHITAIPDDIIMNGLKNKTLKYDFEDIFEQILIKRTVEPIGEELMNEIMLGDKLKITENEVREDCGSDYIFLDLCASKGHVYIYALPNCIDNAHCVVEDIVKSMLNNILSENQVEILELKKAQNKVRIEVNWSKGAVASSLSRQTRKSLGSLKNNVPIKEEVTDKPVSFPYYLYISWMRRYCIGEGIVTFGDKESFMEARKLGMKYVTLLGTEVFIQLSDKDKFQLRLTSLPPETCNKNLEKELCVLLPNSKIERVELKYKNPFETSDEELQKILLMITTKCMEYDLLDHCDIIIPKPNARDVDMVAKIYTHNNEILDFIAEIILGEFVEIKKVITEVKFYLLVKCSPAVYNALGLRFNSQLEQLQSYLKSQPIHKANLQFNLNANTETEDVVTLKVSSSNNELIPLLHCTINNLLEGEILSAKSIKGLENLFFHGGHIWLRNLEKTENLYILEDKQVKDIRLYGSEESCYNAKSQIIKFLEDAEEDVMLTIPLCGEINSSLLLKAIIKEYGVNLKTLIESCNLRSTLLDIKARQLLLRGSREAVDEAENRIRALSEDLDIANAIPGQSQEVCPVCACPASNLAFRLEHCGHLYCIECIQALIEQAQFPLRCCAEKCSKDIVLKDIKKVLKEDSEKIRALVEKSMKDYLERNRVSVVFCPVADCSMFFNKAELSGNKVNCSLCQNEICTRCNVLYHRGYTCEMYQHSKNDPDYSFKVWQKTTTKCKQCPNCKTAIEKIEGCNRMICSSCRGKFCWICLKQFPTEQGVYQHIHSAHRGMLFVQV